MGFKLVFYCFCEDFFFLIWLKDGINFVVGGVGVFFNEGFIKIGD